LALAVQLQQGPAASARAHIYAYTVCRSRSIWTRRPVGGQSAETRHGAGALPAGGRPDLCDGMRCDAKSTRCKWWARRQQRAAAIKKGRSRPGFASLAARRERVSFCWFLEGMPLLLLQCRQVHLSKAGGPGPPRRSTSSSCLARLFVLFSLTLLQMSKGRGERDGAGGLEDSSPLSPV